MIIDNTWTLFLDRDGVINRRILGGYVTKIEEFEPLPGIFEAIRTFNKIFARTCIVTNQSGVGKGLMSQEDLNNIHSHFMDLLNEKNAIIDGIYCCTSLETDIDNCRKPLPDMAIRAKQDFREIDFSRSIMVGDTGSDMEFGYNIGALNVLILDGSEHQKKIDEELVNLRFPSLLEFSQFLVASYN
ncbi:MAG: HAD-IIIA family hydrolase [Saprospiraceae bacterium]|nr:MAG: histidinol-phosphate phosphatase [Candidatus Parvibacillus calidus]MBX2935813.1 HAD-IIIA family hydrolase [Saprospiraceae bacterium]MBK7741702.1 HAD-IIIA family hydrolase [Candidatus Parvibacillus calidus]MBX7178414.1 HAD-IIIA family hydrolase [Saprospiraceae bacterium]MCB0591386.1 HAD-IIIA family hydrolase [Saprospiraceae bacterium]